MEVTISGLDKIVESLNNAPGIISRNIRTVLNVHGRKILDSVRVNSPVQSGAFQASWRIDFSNNSCRIVNSSPQAAAIEIGSNVGEHPWPNVGEKGKTVMSQGKIWSSQAVGGVIDRSTPNGLVNVMTEDFATAVIKVLVK